MKIASIARDVENSPNMALHDAAILECIAKELIALGAEVVPIKNLSNDDSYDAILHMSRTYSTLDNLARAEERGTIVLNSTESVKRCSRISFMNILQSNGIKQPPFNIIEEEITLEGLPYPAWIKKADGWSCHKDDVAFARNATEAKKIFRNMRDRGISKAICSLHIDGDLIKFYAVNDNWFHYCYPEAEKTKFGLEMLNGNPRKLPFNIETMKETIFMAARCIGISIYGGDCIVDAKGDIHIIDLNDFPSFSAVREQAAREIAGFIATTIQKSKKR